MSHPIAQLCSICARVLNPNELREVSVCPLCAGTLKLVDAGHGNAGHPGTDGRLLSIGKRVYSILPKRLRVFISPVSFYFYELLNSIRPQVWSIAGEVCGSQSPVSVRLHSTTAQFRSFAGNLIFGPSHRALYLGRTWVWNTQKNPKGAGGFDILMSEAERPFQRLLLAGCGVVIPFWVYGEATLPRTHREKQQLSAKSRYRKIRQHSLEFEITHDQRLFDDFYDNMLVPHAKQRFGDSAHLTPRMEAQSEFDEGELLLVRKKGEYISGELIRYEGSCACLGILGVRDGNWEYVQNGAISALFEFALRHAEEKGCRKAKFYRSRAFLEDGVLRFKRTLSQRIVAADRHKLLLRILSDSAATRAFLENSPFLFERFGKLHGAVFVNGEGPLTLEVLRKMNKQYFHPGMSQLVVFQFSPEMKSSEGGPASGLPAELSSSHSTDPSDPFCFKQLSRAEWTDLIRGLGCTGIRQAIAIYSRETN